MYNSLSKITEIQSNCQKIIQDFKNHIRYIKKFTQKYQLENVLEEEVEEITTEFMKYIKENYLKSCPINPQEKKTFEEASFTNQVWRDFMKQQLVKYNTLEGQNDIRQLPYKLSKNSDKEVTLKLMDLQGIINEMEKWSPRDEDIQNINKEFKRMIRSIKVKEQSNDNEIPDIYSSSRYTALINTGKERNKFETLIRQTNDRLHKYRIVINEDEKTKSVIDINEYLRERGIGSINEFLVGRPTNKDTNIGSDSNLKEFYKHVLSRFHSTKIQNLLNQQQFQNTFKTNMKEFDESITFSDFITDKNIDRSDLEEETKENIALFLKDLYLFYDLLNKFLSNKYGIEFIPNFRIIDTSFSKKKEPSLLLKQKYLDRIVEKYNKLQADYQENVWNVLYPPPKATTFQMLKRTFGFAGAKTDTKTTN
jgi:hypothetical protein